MNIDEYRAMKEAEASQSQQGGAPDAQVEQSPIATPEQVVQETPQVTDAPQVDTAQEQAQEVPTRIKYGEQELDVEELVQTKQQFETVQQQINQMQHALKEAQIAKVYYDKLMEDPEYAKTFAQNKGLPYVDPAEQAQIEMQTRYNALLLEREIENMQIKYQDFNPQEVVQFAVDKNISNLEDAYLLRKAHSGGIQPVQTPDVDSLKEQIRQEVLNELQSNVNTSSLIGTSGAGAKNVTSTTPELTASEIKVAQGMGMTPEEYSKWKNA